MDRWLVQFQKRISTIDIHYIYPFLFDFQALESFDNLVESWNRKNLMCKELRRGLPITRRGLSPILPYKALEEELGYWIKPAFIEQNPPIVKLVPRNRQHRNRTNEQLREIEEVKLFKTFIVRQCGNGNLTYCLSRNIDHSNAGPTLMETLRAMFRLVPRYGARLGAEGVDQEYSDEYLLKEGVTSELFEHVSRFLKKLEKDLDKKFDRRKEKDINSPLWEDREAIFVGGKGEKNEPKTPKENKPGAWPRPVLQPYAFIILHLGSDYDDFRKWFTWICQQRANGKDIKPEGEKLVQFLTALIYRYWEPKVFTSIDENTREITKIESWLSSYKNIRFFPHHTSTLAIVDASEGPHKRYIYKWYLPAIINTIEFSVSLAHFGLILDALLDKLLRKISTISNPYARDNLREIDRQRSQFYRLQLQTALLLEDISQYVTTGPLGLGLSTKLNEVLYLQEIQQRMHRKLEMTERVLLGMQLEIDHALCDLTRPGSS